MYMQTPKTTQTYLTLHNIIIKKNTLDWQVFEPDKDLTSHYQIG